MVQEGIEKRISPRAPTGIRVLWMSDDHSWHEDISRDVSAGGMMLLTDRSVKLGSFVTLNITLPNLKIKKPILARAKVARLDVRAAKQVGLGLCFISLKSENCEVIDDFVCRILGLSHDNIKTATGSGNSTEYTVDMEKLVRNAEEKNTEPVKNFEKDQPTPHKNPIKLWGQRAGPPLLIFIAILILIKIVVSFL
jgi:hypothetical protein